MKNNLKDKIMVVVDILFVLVLCFVILLSTMIITQHIEMNDYTVNGYIISPVLLIAVIVAIGGYLLYLLKTSIKCYDEIEKVYFETKAEEKKISAADGKKE